MLVLYVAAGGALGASLRYIVTSKITNILGAAYPYGTLTVNILGSFLMGVLIEYLVKTLPHSIELRSFLAVGVLGGFTTFSAFSLDVINLFDKGSLNSVFTYAIFSVVISVLALLLGMFLTRSII